MEPFLGQIMMVGFNFAPRGWAFCDGQILSIAQNSALFSLLGTTFGGDGRSTFGLPDLRGRFPIHPGNGPGLPPYTWGQRGGNFQHVQNVAEMANHTHTGKIVAAGDPANTNDPSNNALGLAEAYSDQQQTQNMRDGTVVVDSIGGQQAVNTMPPYLGVYHVIALQGIFPSRS